MVMTSPISSAGRDQPVWLCLLLGIVFVLVGLAVLGDVVLVTIISTIFIGICAIIAGVFEVIHAFWTKGWGGFVWQILLGLLYVAAGVVLVSQPVAGAVALTWLLGIVLLVSGVVRVYVGFRNGSSLGWLLALSGVFAVLAGLVIISGWPLSGLWVIGFILGIDLMLHGAGWFVMALQPARVVA
jgi:uncharacterized membrane protein HdeD (DUF308 family)